MIKPNNNFIQIKIPIPRAICRPTFFIKMIMAFSIIYFTHFITLKSLNSSKRLSNNSILFDEDRTSFDVLLHRRAYPGSKPRSEDFGGSSEQDDSLVEEWKEEVDGDSDNTPMSDRFDLDKFDPENYATEEDYGDDEVDEDDGEDEDEDEEEEDEEEDEDYENPEDDVDSETEKNYKTDYLDEVSPEQDTNRVNSFPENAENSLMDMDTDLDNTETRTDSPEINTISENDFKFIVSERRRGVTAKMYLAEDSMIKLNNGSLISQEKYLVLPDKNSVNYMENILKNRLSDIEQAQKLVVPTLMSYDDPKLTRPAPESLVSDKSPNLATGALIQEIMQQRKYGFLSQDEDVRDVVPHDPDNKGIPKIVHYVSFSCRKFRIHHYLSYLSVIKVLKPDKIYLHTDCSTGFTEDEFGYWNSIRKLAGDLLRLVKRSPPTTVFGTDLKVVEHKSDVARLLILLEVGGIYLDDDVVVLKSFSELMRERMVLGEENYDALANSVILANKDSWFLQKWFLEYRYFNDAIWSHHSCFVPWGLWQLFPLTIHVAKENMLRPNWEEIYILYKNHYDFSNNYAIHLYARFLTQVDKLEGDRTIDELVTLDTTYGEIARFVMFDDKTIRPPGAGMSAEEKAKLLLK